MIPDNQSEIKLQILHSRYNMGMCALMLITTQAAIFIVLSWMTLGCRLHPYKMEYHEVTLIKMLYLYDPDYCGKVFFYNHTLYMENNKILSSILWPNFNGIASAFRHKLSIWLFLHIFWLFFGAVCMAQDSRRLSTFYTSTIPFTVIGICILIFDFVNTVIFMIDAVYTETELDILVYIEQSRGKQVDHFVILNSFYKFAIPDYGYDNLKPKCDDTSWIALMMAFFSSKAIVQWFVNLWIIKDVFVEGMTQRNIALEHERHYQANLKILQMKKKNRGESVM